MGARQVVPPSQQHCYHRVTIRPQLRTNIRTNTFLLHFWRSLPNIVLSHATPIPRGYAMEKATLFRRLSLNVKFVCVKN
jgi:hypothetical protein